MKRFTHLFSRVPAIVLQLLLAVFAAGIPSMASGQTCNANFCTIDLNSNIYIMNNGWGWESSPSGWSESITRNSNTAWRTDFNWPSWPSGDSRNNNVKAYPSAILGWHWGWHFSQSATGLPRQLNSNYTATSNYSYSVTFGGGTGNVAYDLWITTESNPGSSTQPTDEVMIWVNSSGGAGPCGGVTVSNINLNGATWNLSECQIPGYQYVWSFVRTSNSSSGTINFKTFIDYLRNNRGLSSSKYLASIEFGTEIFRGQGNLNVTNYTCTVSTGGGTTYYKFRNRATSLYIDGMGRTTNGSNCGQWSNSSSYNQQWAIVSAGSYVKLQNRATGLYLDGMGRTANGSNCGQWSNSSSYNQQWTQTTSGGYSRFQNRATGLYVDGMGRTANGSDLGQWSSSSSYNQQWAVSTVTSKVGDSDEGDVEATTESPQPASFILDQNNPNPFNPATNISYTLQNDGKVHLAVYDLLGREVLVLVNETQSAGSHEVTFSGNSLSSGIYFYRLRTAEGSITKKMLLAK
jgi:hypothetical protein